MQQDHELDEVRAGLLPERLLAAAKQVRHQRGNAVRERVGIRSLWSGLYRNGESRLTSI